jgi:osmotically-inducible protein OsmY
MSTETRLEDDVRAALERDPQVKHPDRIAVSADGIGTVVLRGAVESPRQRLAALDDARHADGVFNVIDELKVHPPIAGRGADDRIRAEALRRLTGDYRFRNDEIDVQLAEGWATLTGHVRDDSHIGQAAEAVESVDGVVGVISEIKTR